MAKNTNVFHASFSFIPDRSGKYNILKGDFFSDFSKKIHRIYNIKLTEYQ